MQKQNKAKTKRIRDKHAFLTNLCLFQLLARKKSADSQLAGRWEFVRYILMMPLLEVSNDIEFAYWHFSFQNNPLLLKLYSW